MTLGQYSLVYSQTSREQIRRLHPDMKRIVRERLDMLSANPLLGKMLKNELAGYFSLRTNRYGIVYKIKDSDRRIEIHYVGHRRDIYEIIKDSVVGDKQ